MRLSPIALLLPLLLGGCAVSTGLDETPGDSSNSPGGEYTPPEDNSADDDLQIIGTKPATGASYLPPAVYMVTQFSEPFLGEDGDLIGTFGPNCGGGAYLKSPIFNEDRTEVAYTLFAPTGESFCFDLEISLNDTGAYVSQQLQVNTAPCGVSFNLGFGARFVEVGGETAIVDSINDAIAEFSFPMAISFSDIPRAQAFPFQTTCGLARILQVYNEDLSPSGQWAFDPTLGATEVIQGCGVNGMGNFVLQASSLTLPINLKTGGIKTDGTPIDFGIAYELTLQNAHLSTVASTSGAFDAMGTLTLEGAISQEDLTTLASQSGNSSIEDAIGRLTPDVDVDGNGTPESFSVVMESDPQLISLMGCDGSIY